MSTHTAYTIIVVSGWVMITLSWFRNGGRVFRERTWRKKWFWVAVLLTVTAALVAGLVIRYTGVYWTQAAFETFTVRFVAVVGPFAVAMAAVKLISSRLRRLRQRRQGPGPGPPAE